MFNFHSLVECCDTFLKALCSKLSEGCKRVSYVFNKGIMKMFTDHSIFNHMHLKEVFFCLFPVDSAQVPAEADGVASLALQDLLAGKALSLISNPGEIGAPQK